jgi:hypothetical protein
MATVSRAFFDDFTLVHEAFHSTQQEIDDAKAIARADLEAAARTYHTSAVMIRAGWKPLEQQLVDFVAATNDPQVIALFAQEQRT